jgi:spermidine synthase
MKMLHRVKGIGHDLIVTQQGSTLTLWSASGIRHTVFDLETPHLPGLEYARNTLLSFAFSPEAQSILLLGLGGGSIYHMLRSFRPSAAIDIVEIDPAVVDLARRFFQIGSGDDCHVHLGDAAGYVAATSKQYDIIILDAYVGDKLPDQFTTVGFFENAARRLRAGGVLVVNWMPGIPKQYVKTLAIIEKAVGRAWVLAGYHSRNTLLFASSKEFARKALLSAAGRIEEKVPGTRAVARLARYLHPA